MLRTAPVDIAPLEEPVDAGDGPSMIPYPSTITTELPASEGATARTPTPAPTPLPALPRDRIGDGDEAPLQIG